MDKINNINAYSKSKMSLISCSLIILIAVIYFAVNFFTTDYQAEAENPLTGKAFTTLDDLKKNNIRFTGIETVLNKLFNYTNNININIDPSKTKGRYDPFSI
jgi:hypothetical protein